MLDLQVQATGITSGGVSGSDTIYEFTALPGDAEQTGDIVNGADLTDVEGRQNSLIFAGGGVFLDYDFFSDVNGDAIINGADTTAIVERQNSLVATSSPLADLSNGSDGDSKEDKKELYLNKAAGNASIATAQPFAQFQNGIEVGKKLTDLSRDSFFESESANENETESIDSSVFEATIISDLLSTRKGT